MEEAVTKAKMPRSISIWPEILAILIGILILFLGVNQAIYYRKALARDRQRIEMIKSLQNALEEYYKLKGSYPNDGGNSWYYLVNDLSLKSLFDFDSFSDPCGQIKKYEETSDGIAKCGKRKIFYKYSGINCTMGCHSYLIILGRETGGQQTFSPKGFNNSHEE